MTLPAIPNPATLATPQHIADAGRSVVEWANQCDDIADVKEARNRWAAITEYVRRQGREGIELAEAAERYLEQRIGELLLAMRQTGELAGQGERTDLLEGSKKSTVTDLGLESWEASEFVAMAEHAEIVETVIASSTRQSPPTRNRVRTAIREHRQSEQRKRENEENREAMAERGIVPLTDPGEIARARRQEDVFAHLLGSMNEVIDFRDTYGIDALAEFPGDRFWPMYLAAVRQVADFCNAIIEWKDEQQAS